MSRLIPDSNMILRRTHGSGTIAQSNNRTDDDPKGATMIFNSAERVVALTAAWSGERLEDGRPKVSDDIIERMKLVTNDEAWGVLERRHGYYHQFEGNWLRTQSELVLSGRAITAQMVPLRPDLNDVVQQFGTQ